MGPRKRSKPNPKAEAESPAVSQSQIPESQTRNLSTAPLEGAAIEKLGEIGSVKSANGGANTLQSNKTSTWYGGTWLRGNKATPVTQLAKESISAAGEAASDAVTSTRAHTPRLPSTPLKSPAVYLSRTIGSSTRSLPLAATTTKLNITSSSPTPANGASPTRQPANIDDASQGIKPSIAPKVALVEEKGSTPPQCDSSKKVGPGPELKGKPPEEAKVSTDSASWLNWSSRLEASKGVVTAAPKLGAKSDQTGDTTKDRPQSTVLDVPQEAPPSPKQRRKSDSSPVSPKAQQEQPPRSWLGLWGNATTQSESSVSANASGIATNISSKPNETLSQRLPAGAAKVDLTSTPRPPPQPADSSKSYGWALWSRDQSRDGDGEKAARANVRELAQAGSPSQSKPENAVVDAPRGVPNKVGKTQRPQCLEANDDAQKSRSVEQGPRKESKSETSSVTLGTKPLAEASLKAKNMPQNLLLPSFKRTYRTVGRPTLIQQLSRLLQLSSTLEPKHVDIAQTPHQIRSALAIGVHGYFPVPLIRSVLGQPTGTSIRFANCAASAIQRWTQDRGYSCQIEKVALEGEGKIAERIDLLWKLMLNWIEKIRKADFVMVACHSQGVPVAMMLITKLIAFGCVNSAKIGVCAMAGVNLGPFADYKSRWISGSAGELFDFARPDSQVSKDYEAALDVALKFGVRIVYIGSIDDQLVSLESSTFGTISHPYIYRAVFVDGRVHAPDFLTHLVGFALKLRNLGISDHGLIRELSTPLAGSLYGGEGHSRIYDDEAVYYLAVEHALETTSLGTVPLQTHRANLGNLQNPYILPFAMRGLLEEDYVRTELYGEITELIKQFDDWKPSSKVLKDVKFRLEGVRSKL